MAINEETLNEFMARFVGDMGSVMHAATVAAGDLLGLYKALAEGPGTAEELTRRTETDARYLREWLSAQAASGYVQNDAKTQRFSMTEEQAFALTQEGSPSFIAGASMVDPTWASAHVKQSLKPDGTWMIVEPFANDRLEDNLNPIGRVFYSSSPFICTPASRAQEAGLCLGAQAGEARLRKVVTAGGFSQFRRAAQTPFNLVYEARP